MFAIIADGGRQYRVSPGDRLSIDYRDEVKAGDAISFDSVLLANGGAASLIGQPTIAGAVVQTEVLYAEDKGQKLEVQRLRKRKNSRRHTGHRQKHTTIEIKDVQIPGLEIVESAPPKDESKPEPTPAGES